jgi:protein involved in polysaccharide export with SLBB domain
MNRAVHWSAKRLIAGAVAILGVTASTAAEAQLLNDLLGLPQRRVVRPGTPTAAEGGPVATEAVGAQPTPAAAEPKTFGASLFEGAQPAATDAPNPNYAIVPGDRISVRVWGAIEADTVAVVDPDGAVFIPSVGPLQVAGVRAGDLGALIDRQVRSIYPTNVQTYSVLLGRQRIGVFVTGFVRRPGRYGGGGSDSVLDFLVRAGGVDPSRGSYRDIVVKRADRVVATVDLYRFLLSGTLPRLELREGDTIVVNRQRSLVAADGAVRNDFLFEMPGGRFAGRELLELARPLPSATHAVISGNRNGEPFSRYVTVATLATAELVDQDRVSFVTDAPPSTLTVKVEGSRLGPSVLVTDREIRLRDALDHIAVDPVLADTDSVYLLRKSVADQQTRTINEALDRLERTLYLTVSVTTGEADIRASEAQLISQFIQKARKLKAEGRLVVTNGDGDIANIRLEDGDIIVIPERSQVVMVAGEVQLPQAIVHKEGMAVDDYVRLAGGYSPRGQSGNFMIRRANGEIVLDQNVPVRPGDEVIVLPRIDPKYFQLARDFVSVLYQVAIAARVAADLRD